MFVLLQRQVEAKAGLALCSMESELVEFFVFFLSF